MHDQDTAYVELRARDGSIRAYAVIDAADAEWAAQWKWCFSKGYASRSIWLPGESKTRTLWMHRELLGLSYKENLQGDHINRNRLDNRRANLRRLTRGQNAQNQSVNQNARSLHRGVTRANDCDRWRAQVGVNGKLVHLGMFKTEEDAANAARAGRARLLPFAVD